MRRIGKALIIALALTVPGQAVASDVRAITYSQVVASGDQWARGAIFGAFVAAPITCPPSVSSNVIKSSMEALVYNEIKQPSETFLAVFYTAAKQLGCRPLSSQ